MKPSRIVAVDHLHREASAGHADALRWFYTEIGMLEEVSVNAEGLVFRSQQIGLRFRFVEQPSADETALPIMLRIPSLTTAADLLADRHFEFEWLTGLYYVDRGILVIDPAGHRVELRQEWGEGTI